MERRLSVDDASHIVTSMISDGRRKNWFIGDLCRIEGVDGLLHNACVESINPSTGVATVRFQETETTTDDVVEDVPITLLRVHRNNIRVEQWTVEDVLDWLEEKKLLALVNVFARSLVDGAKLVAFTQAQLEGLGLTRRQMESFLRERKKLLGGDVVRKAPAMTPRYEPPPNFDDPADIEMDNLNPNVPRRPAAHVSNKSFIRAAVHLAESPKPARKQPGARSLRRRSSENSVAFGRTLTMKARSKLDQERRKSVHQSGELLRMGDIEPMVNPDESEAEDDVNTHLQLMEDVKRRKARLFEKVVEYRQEREIVNRQREFMSSWAQFKLFLHFRYQRTVQVAWEYLSTFQLWESSIKTIETKFGTGVAGTFAFQRWMLMLNTVFSVLLVLFLVLPQVTNSSDSTADEAGVSEVYAQLLTGAGSWSDSILMYGYYSHNNVNGNYSIPLAYLLVFGANLALSLYFIVHSLSQMHKKQAIYLHSQAKTVFSDKVLSMWDHAVADASSIVLRRTALCKDLRDLVADAVRFRKTKRVRDTTFFWLRISTERPAGVRAVRALMFMVWAGLTAGCAAGIHFAGRHYDAEPSEDLVESLLPPLLLSAANYVLPVLTASLAQYELRESSFEEFSVSFWRSLITRLTLFATLFVSFVREHGPGQFPCWENRVGQFFYQLVLLDFLLNVLGTVLIHTVHQTLFMQGFTKSRKQFNVAENLLDMVYRQVLVWLGMLFCPLLPVIAVGTSIVAFHVRKLAVMSTCDPPERDLQGASVSYFRKLILVVYFLCLVPISWFVVLRDTGACGPFSDQRYMYDIVPNTIESFPSFLSVPLFFIGTAGFAIPFLGFLLIGVHYFRYHWTSKKAVVDELKYWLHLERTDTRHLLRQRLGVE
eukprot:m.196282 g.196282  ORF g.196282 m.196282 type:complete len:880 (-) comp21833_c0_seq9:147-2786(-)